jgi:hypothetical protein
MDWTVVISAASAGVVGVTGIVATYRAGRRQQVTALEVARMQIESHERMAREERHQKRLEKAYESLLKELGQPPGLLHLESHGSSLSKDAAEVAKWLDGVPPRTDGVVVLAACHSARVANLHESWKSERDPDQRTRLAGEIRSQIRARVGRCGP